MPRSPGARTARVHRRVDRLWFRATLATTASNHGRNGDPDRNRWNQKSLSSGELALEYGFSDVDGSRPDVWRYIEQVGETGLQVNLDDYR